jgi:hypothetical protein
MRDDEPQTESRLGSERLRQLVEQAVETVDAMDDRTFEAAVNSGLLDRMFVERRRRLQQHGAATQTSQSGPVQDTTGVQAARYLAEALKSFTAYDGQDGNGGGNVGDWSLADRALQLYEEQELAAADQRERLTQGTLVEVPFEYVDYAVRYCLSRQSYALIDGLELAEKWWEMLAASTRNDVVVALTSRPDELQQLGRWPTIEAAVRTGELPS